MIISLILVVVAIGVWSLYLSKDDTPSAADNSRALIGGAFELTNHKNEMVSDKDFLGKYMIVYFGYTYCPDVCPMDLQIMTDSMHHLPQEIANKVTPVFVTIDPERDTVEVMAEYVQYFHEDLVGLTGTLEQINTIKKA
ncbi:MAG: SCO family protein, partial [Kordiimonadaceae bacterium]|nr:SCO family protein [Kordiimonadaceae bacterium]